MKRKRSSCDSGSGKMPVCSKGFCVAITMNGLGSQCIRPSAVTCRSCIASSRLACVRGGVRLISSASRTFVKTAPGTNCSSPIFLTVVPTMWPGVVSGVNWIRLNCTPSTRATPAAISVFATPGGPSSRTWPPATAATSKRSTCSS